MKKYKLLARLIKSLEHTILLLVVAVFGGIGFLEFISNVIYLMGVFHMGMPLSPHIIPMIFGLFLMVFALYLFIDLVTESRHKGIYARRVD